MSAEPMGVLQRAAEVVELLAEAGPLTGAEVAARTGVPRPSVHRLADALVRARLVEVAEDGRLRAGRRWLRLAEAARSGMTEWSDAGPVLEDLARATGLTAYLTVPQADRVVCVDWAPGAGLSLLALRPGRGLPLHAGAEGRAALAYRAEPVDAYLATAPHALMTPRTLVGPTELRADVEATRGRGFSVSDGDVTPGIGALGAPVLGPSGVLLGVLSVAGVAERLRREQGALAERLVAAAGSPGLTRPRASEA